MGPLCISAVDWAFTVDIAVVFEENIHTSKQKYSFPRLELADE